MSARNAAWWALAAACCCCWAAPARGGPWVLAPGEFYSSITGSFYSADHFFGATGISKPLAFGGVQEERSVLSYNEIGWKKNTSLIVGVPVASVTRVSAGNEVNRTDTGISDLQLGMRIRMSAKPSAAALQITWFPPAGYNRTYLLSSDTLAYAANTACKGLSGPDSINCARQLAPPRLGAGQQELAAQIDWGTPLPRWNGFLQVSNGYRYRGTLAGQAVIGADLGFWFGHSLLIAGRYRGAIDVGRGPTPADDVEEHLAGPVVLFRLDDGMDVFYSSMHTAAAKNAIRADRYYLGVAFRKTSLNRLQGYLGSTRAP